MRWLKEVVVDIAATVLIILTVTTSIPFLDEILTGYTLLILLVKLVALLGEGFIDLMSKSRTQAPLWFTHLMYALNTSLLLFFQWWILGSCWALIWLISFLTEQKMTKRTA